SLATLGPPALFTSEAADFFNLLKLNRRKSGLSLAIRSSSDDMRLLKYCERLPPLVNEIGWPLASSSGRVVLLLLYLRYQRIASTVSGQSRHSEYTVDLARSRKIKSP